MLPLFYWQAKVTKNINQWINQWITQLPECGMIASLIHGLAKKPPILTWQVTTIRKLVLKIIEGKK
ncbi:hypothetical protein A3B54_04885 [Candidatus Curtissbacteria bacterium RIFCSPLOWO2_01_FULL_42_50]|uniref:Uncharacterized protein n=1 Tax=Candidatus Curtissbacteria bacterium RIFCSPLOWO2_01_FULL_42_50 TaxID=1797730 RepID=A0A1F5H3V5_9BACT|nr:MAG: hypothetical protein A3B54_04885 [Candidatus Curtissbacteria bacterium RIFCSPLOWO2_01_FULL_42_50]